MNIEPKKYTGTPNLLRDTLLELTEFLKTKLEFEKRVNQSNFDSGIPIEDYFREEFKKLIPPKYALTNGTIIDKNNNTCGDCDVIFYDKFSSPMLRIPSTDNSRRKFLPCESIYGIVEVKQTLNLGALDNDGELSDGADTSLISACEKIAQFKALERGNFDDDIAASGLVARDRPFGYVLFLDGPEEKNVDAVHKEIRRINERIPKELRADGILVLDKYAFTWFRAESRDLNVKLSDASKLLEISKETLPEFANGNGIVLSRENTLYYLFSVIWHNLSNQKLIPPDFYEDYGGKDSLKHQGSTL